MAFRLSRSEGGADKVNFINLIWRVFQFLIGLAVLVLYATQPSYQPWLQVSRDLSFSLGIAAGAIAMITAPIFGVIPFIFGYRPIAFACVWDFIVMVIYAAAFAYYKNRFPYGAKGDYYKQELHRLTRISNGRIDVMRAAVTVDLVGMLLWLITLLMAVGVLLFSRFRGGKVTY